MKSVAIVGSGPGWEGAPFQSKLCEVWGMNNMHLRADPTVYHFDRWFELHDRTFQEHRNPAHMRVLKDIFPIWEIPIYMQRKWEDYPTSRRFPKEDVEGLCLHGRYHCGSMDWVFCLALYEGFTDIELYGTDFTGGEPASARACLEFWMGFAVGRGVRVFPQKQGDILKALVVAKTEAQYGYDPIFNQNELPLI